MTPRSIALLDLVPRADSFLSDGTWAELAAALQSRGHRVRVVHSVMELDPGGPTAWRERLAEFVRDEGFEIVVLLRAWDGETLAALRDRMAPAGRLVRLSARGAAALDDRFDAVVDGEGLLALAEGGTAPAPPPWRPATKEELRARPPVAAELAWGTPVVLGDVVGGGPRPTIRGPVSGCPYLADARAQPLFADLDLDARAVQTRGCTFCLDNTGAYAVPTEAQVLGAWLPQLRALRARRPDFREVLLLDERPHPYLPALFEALVREPGLAPIELLFKSRVDWLLEFADGALARAAELAERTHSVLHLYLVGFESFDQFHLDLFNKGVRVEDNVAAVAKLRELAARFPRSFEFRRYRCHGLVLFTPWTSPESLIENARWMRAIGFEELRAEALRTRLRLYPRLPLHALARRDGLLTDAFVDDLRPDRAREQGYDASVPWRFRDDRTEAIYQAANALRGRGEALADADALEIAARFVLRHPAFGEVPAATPAALLQAVRAWGDRAVRELCGLGAAAIAGYDLEIESVLEGRRAAAVKEQVPADDVDSLLRAYRVLGLHAERVHAHGVSSGGDQHRAGATHALVAVARDPDVLAELVDLQRSLLRRRDPAVVQRLGTLLGYPECCAASHADRPDGGDNLENERWPFRARPDAVLHPVLHRLGAVAITPHHLCAVDCASSIAMAQRTLAVLRALHPEGASWIEARLRCPALFIDYQRRLELEGRWEGDRFHVQRASSLGRPFPIAPEQIESLRLSARSVEVALKGGGVRTLAAVAPLLTSPGEPLAPPAFAALGAPAHAGRADALPSLRPIDPAAFLSAYFAGRSFPIALAGGWRIAGIDRPERGGSGLDLVLECDGVGRLRVHAERREEARARFTETSQLALSHHRPPPGLGPKDLEQALWSLRDYLLEREGRAGSGS